MQHGKSFKAIIAIGIISIMALALRLWNIDWTGPYDYHRDETKKQQLISRQLNSDEGLRYFKHPHFMLTSAAMIIRVKEAASFPMTKHEQALLARKWIAFIAAATVLATGLLGFYWKGPAVGIGSAILLSVYPLHVQISRYIKEDIGLAFWLVLTCLATVMLQKTKRRWLGFFILGSACGGAFSAKWVGVLVLIPVIYEIRYLFRTEQTPKKDRRRLYWLFAGGLALQFFLWNPTMFQDWYYLFRDLGSSVAKGGWEGHRGIRVFGFKYLFLWHLTHSLLPGMGITAVALSVIGIFFALRNRYGRTGWLIALFALTFYLSAEISPLKATLDSERYMAGVLPFLALLAAAAAGQLAGWLTRKMHKRALTSGLGVLCIALAAIPALANSIAFSKHISNDTRTVARQWILDNLPSGSTLAYVGASEYFPQQLDAAGVTLEELSLSSISSKKKKNTAEKIRAALAGYDYLLVSSFDRWRSEEWPTKKKRTAAFYQEIFAHYPVIKKFASVAPSIFWPDFSHPIEYGFNQPTLWIFKVPSR